MSSYERFENSFTRFSATRSVNYFVDDGTKYLPVISVGRDETPGFDHNLDPYTIYQSVA